MEKTPSEERFLILNIKDIYYRFTKIHKNNILYYISKKLGFMLGIIFTHFK